MDFLNNWILTILIFLPTAGAILVLMAKGRDAVRWTALGTTIITFAASLLLFLLGCGKKDAADPVAEAYNSFKYRNTILGQTFPGGRTLDGSIDLDASRDAGGAEDWIEVAINGDIQGRSTGSKQVSLQVKFRPGPNKVSFFISAARRYWELDMDARLGTRTEFTPTEGAAYAITQRKDE